jgi:hypothetical protein
MLRAALALVLVGLAAVACGAGTGPSDEPHLVGCRVEQAGWVLEVVLPSDRYAPTDAIPVQTTVTWTGAPGRGSIWGSGSGPVSFLFLEIGGAGRTMNGAMTSDCAQRDFAAGEPVTIPLGKSGGWTAEDPNAAFYQAWYRDPLLHLPSGHWQLRVSLDGMLAPCDANAARLDATVGPIDLLIE